MHGEFERDIEREGALTAPPGRGARAQPACFRVFNTHTGSVTGLSVHLTTRHAEALAELLPLLLCGEESAALAFARHAGSAALPAGVRADLDRIRSDEERHALWLQQLTLGLPAPRHDARLRLEIRRFYNGIHERDPGRHLARIAALDSAVCALLGVLRRRGGAIATEVTLSGLFAQIHRDEARHAAVAGRHAHALAGSLDVRSAAVDTRESLRHLLAPRAGALERLGVCPDAMLRRLTTLPQRLFR